MDPSLLIRRYRPLWIGGLFSAVLFPVLLLWFAAHDGVWSDWVDRGYAVTIVGLRPLQRLFA